jgi:hypothetical protein
VSRQSRALTIRGEGGIRTSARRERRAGGYIAPIEDMTIAEGALVIQSAAIEQARAEVEAADERMIEAAEAWLAASRERFEANRRLGKLLTNSRRVLSRPSTLTGRLMGDPAPGRTPWAGDA